MDAIETGHLAWSTTFPHRVVPRTEEWLPGLLLRCDLANHWASKTAMLLLQHGRSGAALTATPTLAVVPLWMSMALAEHLALPLESLLATTYQRELMRLYAPLVPHWKQLNATCVFRACPECVAQDYLLTRLLVLPHIHACPQHHVALLSACQCRLPKRLAVSYQKVGHKYYIYKKTLIVPHKMRSIQKRRLLFPLDRELKSNFSNLCALEGREVSGEWQYEG